MQRQIINIQWETGKTLYADNVVHYIECDCKKYMIPLITLMWTVGKTLVSDEGDSYLTKIQAT